MRRSSSLSDVSASTRMRAALARHCSAVGRLPMRSERAFAERVPIARDLSQSVKIDGIGRADATRPAG
jgi:hypothetical protein